MTVDIHPQYSGTYPNTHARIAHANNWFTTLVTANASSTATGYFADAPDTSLTYEKWKPASLPATWQGTYTSPDGIAHYCCIGAHTLGSNGCTFVVQRAGATHTNLMPYSSDFEITAGKWVANAATTTGGYLAPDGSTNAWNLVSDTSNAEHAIWDQHLGGVVNTIYTHSVYAKANGYNKIRLRADSTAYDTQYITVDLTTGNVDEAYPSSAQVDPRVTEEGAGWYRISLKAVSDADGGAYQTYLSLIDDNGDFSFTGDGTSGVLIWGMQVENWGTPTGYIETNGGTSASSTWYNASRYVTPTDDSPIFALFPQVGSFNWRINILNGDDEPEIGVIKFGQALEMPQPLYAGHTPLDMARMPEMRSTKSAMGEFLGRTKIRSRFEVALQWSHLKADWMRTNWPDLQDALMEEPFFIATRPSDTDFGAVGLCYVDEIPKPNTMGTRNFMDVSMNVTAYGY